MQSPDYVRALLHKAADDQFVLELLVPQAESPNEIIGFHAQQALEKLLKAALCFHGIAFRRTHDLVELIDLLTDNGISCPDEVEEGRRLTPFATVFRYDALSPGDDASFDRAWAVDCVVAVREWVMGIIESS